MADADEYDEPSLADDFEEGFYDGNDDDSCIVVEDDTKADDGERVIKLCFSSLIRFHRRNPTIKAHFIDIVQRFVINNTEIAVRASMLLHYIVMDCIRTNRDLPTDFCSRRFIGQVVNFTRRPPLLSDEVIAALGNPFEPPFDLSGRAWLFGYLETTIHGNIESSTMLKWKAVINDSIDAYAIIHLRRASRKATDRIKKELRRQIFSPASNPPNNAPQLDGHAIELVTFHRQGFLLSEDQRPLTEYYIKNTKGSYRHYILHFGHCLHRQENLEREWNATHSPKRKIKLKKRFPLPFFTIEKSKSLQIDKKGLYFIINEFRKTGGDFGANHPPIPRGHNAFDRGLYCEWIKYLFYIDKLIYGTKMFKFSGVGITTNAVSASLHYNKPEWDEDVSLHQSIMALNLTPCCKDDEDEDTVEDESYNPFIEGNSIHSLLFWYHLVVLNLTQMSLLFNIHNNAGVIPPTSLTQIVVDPGLTNIITAHLYQNMQIVAKFRLTRAQYYSESMVDYAVKRWLVWNNHPSLKRLIKGRCAHHLKKANIDDIITSIQYYQSVRADIRVHKLIPKKFERLNLSLYGKKKAAIHRFLQKMLRYAGASKPIMFYGDGSFFHGGKGMRSVPCKWVKRECKLFFNCFTVDEFRTSQICPTCNERLWDVRKHLRDSEDKRRTKMIRGLKYCSSDTCRSHRYLNRDDVGCYNIYRKSRIEFPEIMERGQPGWEDAPSIHEFRPMF